MQLIKKNSSIFATVSVAILLFITINLIAKELLSRARIDMTENNLYSLSEGTENLLENLTEEITLTFFLSNNNQLRKAGLRAYFYRVKDVLKSFERIADGKINLRFIETESFSPEEDLASRYGIRGIADGNGKFTYFGLAGTNTLGDSQFIPALLPSREDLLEYDLTQLVLSLNLQKPRTIGVVSTLPIQNSQLSVADRALPNWTFYHQLINHFDVVMINSFDQEKFESLDMLVLINVTNLPSEFLFHLEQFALRGNPILIMLDPYAESIANLSQELAGGADRDSNELELDLLLQQWGIKFVGDKIVGDLPIAARVVDPNSSGQTLVDYPVWINVQPEQMNSSDLVTAKLGNIFMATAGVLEEVPNEGLDFVPLISTTEDAKLYSQSEIENTGDLRSLLRNYTPNNKKLPIAARIQGSVKSVFANRGPQLGVELTGDEDFLQEGAVNAIVIADTDFLLDRFWIAKQMVLGQVVVTPQASNGELVFNAINNLANNDELIGIRSRGGQLRPFVKMQQIRKEAQQQYQEQESQLQQDLEKIEQLLSEFEASPSAESQGFLLTGEQQQTMKQIYSKRSEIRTRLREIRRNQNRQIENLKLNVILLNTILPPLMVVLIGLYAGFYGASHRERRLLKKLRYKLLN